MRSLINHLQAQCKLYSLEATRCKKQCKELEDELTKLKVKQETQTINGLSTQISETISTTSNSTANCQQSPTVKEENNNNSTSIKNETLVKEETIEGINDESRLMDNSLFDFSDINEENFEEKPTSNLITSEDKDAEIRRLKSDNKKLFDSVKEYKILLTTYRYDN